MASYWTRKGDPEDLDEKTINPFAINAVKGNVVNPRRRPVRVALFDLDGTLMDTEGQYSVFWGAMGRKYRPDVPNLEQVIKGSTLTRIYNNYFPDEQIQAEITVQLDKWEEQMKYEFFPGALDFIKDLRGNGVRCLIVTSSNMAKMRSVMKQIPDFNSLFDRVLTSEDFAASKPAPDCYLLGAKVMGADLDECVVFEDAYNGLEAGMASGIFTFGLATCNPAEAIRDKCNYVLNGFEGLTYEGMMNIISE